eukprot:6091045-Alexandrium_andersonii.AAC.1
MALKDFLQPIMHLIFLRMTDVDRCVVAAANLRKVITGEMDLGKWSEAEEEFGAAQGWRSFATR